MSRAPRRRVSSAIPRRILGNLDCEVDFARLASRISESPRRRRSPGQLPRRVLSTIAGAATLLRVFAREGDRLWLPAPVTPEAIAEVPGLPHPILESGPLDRLEPAREVLPWGETTAATDLRVPDERTGPWQNISNEIPSYDLPWRLPAPTPAAAAKINDRRFALELADELGCFLPGTCILASGGELKAHLQATSIERWVLKAPFSAAGRWRLIHLGGSLDQLTRRRIDRLFERHGELVFEPWMERTADFGYTAALTPDGLRRVSLHRLRVDRTGQFRGIELPASADGPECPWLSEGERTQLDRVLDGVGEALGKVAYVGPFGLDAWRYRGANGETAFHPLGEINGRLTFGWVARALVDRVRGPLGIADDSRVQLRFGRPTPERVGVRSVPLLHAETPASLGSEIRLETHDQSLKT